MTLFDKARGFAARWARQRRVYAEMALLSDAELRDLNLSLAKIEDLSRIAARAT